MQHRRLPYESVHVVLQLLLLLLLMMMMMLMLMLMVVVVLLHLPVVVLAAVVQSVLPGRRLERVQGGDIACW